MLNKFLEKLPEAVILGVFVFALNFSFLNLSTVGKPVLLYSDFIPPIFFKNSAPVLEALGWIFMTNILLMSLGRASNTEKELKTSRQKLLHGLAIGINCGFIANIFLLYKVDFSIYFALGFIGLISLIILFQDGLLAGLSTTITSNLVFFAIYLSLVLNALVGTIFFLVLITLAFGVIKISKS